MTLFWVFTPIVNCPCVLLACELAVCNASFCNANILPVSYIQLCSPFSLSVTNGTYTDLSSASQCQCECHSAEFIENRRHGWNSSASSGHSKGSILSRPADTRKAVSLGQQITSASVTSYYSTTSGWTETTSSSSTSESTETPFDSRESRRSSESSLDEGLAKGVELIVGYHDRPSQGDRLQTIYERVYTKSKTQDSMYRCVGFASINDSMPKCCVCGKPICLP